MCVDGVRKWKKRKKGKFDFQNVISYTQKERVSIIGGQKDMGIYLNAGYEKFARTVRSKIYIDKTGLLEYINSVIDTDDGYICLSRPRRFGKSIAAAMLSAYYGRGENAKKIFDSLAIAKAENYAEHLNQYDVIQVDMNVFRHRRDVETESSISAKKAVSLFHQEVIEELKEAYPECLTDEDGDLPSALTKVYRHTGIKFVIIIDEWDTIFREDKYDYEAQKLYIELLRGLFKNDTSKEFLALGYLTGILPIKKYGTESALNNFDEFTMINPQPLEEYVGFTEQEVYDLFQEYHMDFEEAKRWYDGYMMGEDIHIYNPKSVVDSVRRKRITNYWTRTETYESLRNYITMNYDGLKDAVIEMLAGGRCVVNPDKFQNDMTSFASKDDILALLIHLGYLGYDYTSQEVYIPNEEIRSEFKNAVEGSGWTPVIDAMEASKQLLNATWELDEEAVAAGIEQVHMENVSVLKYNDENSLSCVITLAYYHAKNEYTLIREMPTGKGYADIVFLPRKKLDKPAMIVELKCGSTVQGAIAQIKEKKYTEKLEEYKGNMLLVGIEYDKETKKHRCMIEKA